MTNWLKDTFGTAVEKVTVSQRLAQSPMAVVAGQYGYSANMERLIKSQAFADANQHAYMASKKVVEINPYHPIVKRLRDAVVADADAKANKDLAKLLYDSALLQSGFAMEKAEDFAARVQRVVAGALNVGEEEQVEAEPEEDLPEPVKEEAETVDLDAAAETTETPVVEEPVKVSIDDKDEL